MRYKLYNKTRFLKNDEVVLDQEGNFLVLDDGDAPNHIRNCLDIDVLLYTDKLDNESKEIIEGDILIGETCYIVDYHNDKFVLVELFQHSDGDVFYGDYDFGETMYLMSLKRVANVYESKSMKEFYKGVVKC